MLIEILEQPCTLTKTINPFYKKYADAISINEKLFSKLSYITVVGCGSSHFVGLIEKYWLEGVAQVRVYLKISYRSLGITT